MSPAAAKRHDEIDALRVIALGLLIFYHVFICYQPFAPKIYFPLYGQTLESYWFVGEALNIWRIPVLFVISGMAVGFILPRRTIRALAVDRMMRLVPPLFFGAFTFGPLCFVLVALYNGQPLWYLPSPAHLWFLGNLAVYTLMLLPLFFWFKRSPDNAVVRSLRSLLPWGLLVVFPLPLVAETVLNPPFDFAFHFLRFWFGLVSYGLGFLLVALGDRMWPAIRMVCHAALPLALLLYLARIEVLDWAWIAPGHVNTSIESGMWMLAFLGYGSLLLRRPSPVFAYLNRGVFPMYVLHLPVQQLMALGLFRFEINPLLMLGLHFTFTYGLSVGLYEAARRCPPWLGVLVGLAPRKAKPGVDKPASPSSWAAHIGRILTLYVLTPLLVLLYALIAAVVLFGLGQDAGESSEPDQPEPAAIQSETMDRDASE
ncbi:MAG: acyltransferase family protein [Planctomycetota bacterium]